MNKNIKVNICVPQYATLLMGTAGYTITVTLPIPTKIVDILKAAKTTENNLTLTVFTNWKGQAYAQLINRFQYTKPILDAVHKEAPKQLACLQALIRKAKVCSLNMEIAELEKKFM